MEGRGRWQVCYSVTKSHCVTELMVASGVAVFSANFDIPPKSLSSHCLGRNLPMKVNFEILPGVKLEFISVWSICDRAFRAFKGSIPLKPAAWSIQVRIMIPWPGVVVRHLKYWVFVQKLRQMECWTGFYVIYFLTFNLFQTLCEVSKTWKLMVVKSSNYLCPLFRHRPATGHLGLLQRSGKSAGKFRWEFLLWRAM